MTRRGFKRQSSLGHLKVSKKDAIMATVLAEAAKQSAFYSRPIFLQYLENEVVHFNFKPKTLGEKFPTGPAQPASKL